MLLYSILHDGIPKCNPFFFLCVQKEKMKQKYKIYEKLDWKPERAVYTKETKKKKSVRELARLKTRKDGIGKN